MDRALVIGFGVSGKASASLLLQAGFELAVADRRVQELRQDAATALLHAKGVSFFSDREELSLDQFSLIVVSPGIQKTHAWVQKAREKQIEVIGEIELAFRYLPNRTVIGITGSNGKTTTVLLVTHVLNALGMKTAALGNIGAALSTYALQPNPEEMLVVELSSFQLETLAIAPRFNAAAILNITPNHLNWHASMQEYASAKLRIAACLKEKGKLFVSQKTAQEYEIQNADIFDETFPPCRASLGGSNVDCNHAMRLGLPEQTNMAAALALCRFLGIKDGEFFKAAETFRKPPHRIEWVAEINGVAYYNDSKASNVEAVMHAVQLFKGSIILIAGGVDKGSSYGPWIACFKGKVNKLIVFGQAASKIEHELKNDISIFRCETLQEALQEATRSANIGDTVLFSPGCSSFDQFVNFEARGEAFKTMVQRNKRWIEEKR